MEQLFPSKLSLALFLRKTRLGELESAQYYLTQALHLAPSLVQRQDDLVRLIASWVLEQPPESHPTLVQQVADMLPGDFAGSGQLRQHVLGRAHISQAFGQHTKGQGAQTRHHILKGLRYNPSYLRNRGVIAIFAKSFLPKQPSEPESMPHQNHPDESVPPPSVIRRVESVLGGAVGSVNRITKGLSGNKIYLAEVNGQVRILRILRKDVLEPAVAVVKQVRAASVPTPDIIASASLEATDDEPAWLLEEWSSGSEFEPTHLSPGEELAITAELGQYLRGAHEINTKGFGEISSAQLDAPYPTFEAWLDDRQQIIEEGCIVGAIPESALPALTDADHCLRESLVGSPVLCHGDLGRGNILIEGGHLKAIIDWGDAMGGDPAFDIGVFFASMSIYWDSQKISTLLPVFLQTYGADEAANLYERVIAHQLLYAAHEAARLWHGDEAEYFNAFQSILADAGLANQSPAS